MTRNTVFIVLLGCALATPVYAQTAYINDELFVPLRSGPGGDRRIVHRGLPTGTQLTIKEVSEDGTFSLIETVGGSEGWIRSQYLSEELPAKLALEKANSENAALKSQLADAQNQLKETRENFQATSANLDSRDDQLKTTQSELAEIKRISANAISLDQDKRRLLEESEVQRSRIEVLEADNQRLKDSDENEAFINGALAVLLGVMITLVVPRLWPKKRNSSSWA